ncbi:MAG: hypothetical protein AMK70_00340 [Nitrospira bacterium SG8_35_1]|nr:MAG: hypothetical protein AMK70_00340 [Nitrospira bacterium SG8_35_1]
MHPMARVLNDIAPHTLSAIPAFLFFLFFFVAYTKICMLYNAYIKYTTTICGIFCLAIKWLIFIKNYMAALSQAGTFKTHGHTLRDGNRSRG